MSPNGDMNPSSTELIILKHLWRHKAQSLREIHVAIEPELCWSRSSTRKTVERMVDKGWLGLRNAHGLNVYHARARKIPTLAGMIRDFAANVLGLEGHLPVSNLVKSQVLSQEELLELEAYLEKSDNTTEDKT